MPYHQFQPLRLGPETLKQLGMPLALVPSTVCLFFTDDSMRVDTDSTTMAATKKIVPRSVIDNVNEVEPVMNFSFCRLSTIAGKHEW